MSRRSRLLTSLAGVVLLGSLAACAEGAPAPTGESTPIPTVAPSFDPQAGAEANKPYFDYVLQNVIATNPKADSKTLVNALRDAGFDVTGMEVTFDRTTVDLEADYVMVSVKMSDEKCLIGERGTSGYASNVAPALSTGKCMIGKTQDITW